MAREFFCAYHSYLKAIEPLNDAERGRLFTACIEYSISGVTSELRGNERFLFPSIKEQIDRDTEKYAKFCDKQRENIAKRWNTNVYHRIPNDTKHTKDKEKEKDKDKENINIKAQKHRYGEYKHILLTDDEYEKLKSRFPDYEKQIQNLDTGIELKGYKYNSHYLAILKWASNGTKSDNQLSARERFLNDEG